MPGELREYVRDAATTLAGGDAAAGAELVAAMYAELRAIAGAYFRDQPAANTLQPTALVHEVFLRVADRTASRFNDEDHFRAVCAVAMRGILADAARRRQASKRGGDWQRISISGIEATAGHDAIDLLALDDALEALAARNERQARIVEQRYFAGMSVDQCARVLGVSRSTVEEDWRMARAWLTVQLRAEGTA